MIYGCVPLNKRDILTLVTNISSVYKKAVLLNRTNDSLECHCLIVYQITDVGKKRLLLKIRVLSM